MRGSSLGRSLYYGWLLAITLGVTETISWGILYYTFPVFIAPMERELGWSRGALSGAFSAGVLASGAAAVPFGRWLDRHGARVLMTAGSVAGTLLLLGWAAVSSLPQLYALWIALGLAMGAVLYDPAFQVLATWFRRDRARALTLVTLMAALASTIFVPLASWLVARLTWRPALVALAAILATGTILPHALVLRRRPSDLGLLPDGGSGDSRLVPAPTLPDLAAPPISAAAILGRPQFRWLAAAFCLHAIGSIAVGVHLLPYLTLRGYDAATAATATGLVGATQILGRLLFSPLGGRLSLRQMVAGTLAVQPVALLVLLLARGTGGLLVFVLLFGAARGAATLARPTALAEIFGAARYGTVAGLLSLLITLAQALAPVSAGAAYDLLGSYEPVLWALLGVSAAAAVVSLPGTGHGAQRGK